MPHRKSAAPKKPEAPDPVLVGLRYLSRVGSDGKNQKWLAAQIGLSENAVSATMTGKAGKLETIIAMCRAYGMEIDEVIKIGRNLIAGRSPEPASALDLRGTEVAALERRFEGLEKRMDMVEALLRQIADNLALRDRPPQPEATTTRKPQAAR